PLAEKLLDLARARGRHRRHDEAMPRITLGQGFDQRRGRPHLADRDGVYPDRGPVVHARHEAEALGPAMPVRAIPEAAPEQVTYGIGEEQIDGGGPEPHDARFIYASRRSWARRPDVRRNTPRTPHPTRRATR